MTSPHPEANQEPTKTLVTRTEDSPITAAPLPQEIPRDLGVLRQELWGLETKDVYFLLRHSVFVKSWA